MMAPVVTAQTAPASSPSIDEVLSVPYVTGYAADAAGDVAWVEYRRGPRNAFVARSPEYATVKITDFSQDDGDEVTLVGFDAGGGVVFLRGLPGMNPTHRPDGTVVRLLTASEGAPVRTILDEVPAGFSAPVVSPDGRAVLVAVGGEVWSYPLEEGQGEPTRHFAVRGRVTSLVPSPDGGRLAFVTDRSIYDRGKYSYVGVFEFATRKIRFMQPGLGMDQSVTWSPDGALQPNRLKVEGDHEMIYGNAVPLGGGAIAYTLGGPHGPPSDGAEDERRNAPAEHRSRSGGFGDPRAPGARDGVLHLARRHPDPGGALPARDAG
jgi:hypothetical protein